MNYSYLVTDKAIVVTFSGGETRTLDRSHEHASQILKALRDSLTDQEVMDLFSKAQALKKYMKGNIEVDADGNLKYKGEVLHLNVAQKISQFMREGLPFEPLVAFLDRLMDNPSFKSREQLYPFLQYSDITIDKDGFMIAYKAVREDFQDKHSGTFDNRVGCRPSVPRSKVDDDSNHACSYGLHIGSIQYVRGFASGTDRIVKVKADPKDVVSVPTDCSFQKVRVSEYLVIEDMTGKIIPDVATSALYQDDDDDYIPEDDLGCENREEDEPVDTKYTTITLDGIDVRMPKGSTLTRGTDGSLSITVND